ncbi:hypothetical protein [Flavobacterium capsici]|uniref:Uncharacterized protein n=1 Tax=Flavobacterium capsici TaxID=3075618 RepID=A0AA96J2A1_9FLAO|nr:MULTISPECIES: hypothetical protein [unclassified Flavobacterium]WNM18870.1 hypothetical protein RN608_12760 [Flavobacterium sp. PMR2A8]WNM22920.1 hypothetical protein RN605_06060 [Flavobacterium sp. PMTSA4]
MATDFHLGMKVSLSGEYGIVITSNLEEFNQYGIIRWDTEKENDIEDWRGMFGTFKEMGGKMLTGNYEFKFINDDGSSKASL